MFVFLARTHARDSGHAVGAKKKKLTARSFLSPLNNVSFGTMISKLDKPKHAAKIKITKRLSPLRSGTLPCPRVLAPYHSNLPQL